LLFLFISLILAALLAGTVRAAHLPGARLLRPLDPRLPGGAAISIYYELYRHAAPGASAGTIVAIDGGPGYPATLSRADYLALFGPLLDHRDLLLMDNRGTGKSAAVNCPSLQRAPKLTTALIGACGRLLTHRAYLFSTALAADDLAAILDSLNIDRIDLYGNSYGTYFEQTFAVLHPEKLRSLVLDGAYPLNAPDYAWYPTYAPAMRDKFNLTCRRSARCARIRGDSIAHILPALQQLRAKPFGAAAVNADGVTMRFQADASTLATVMFGAAPPYATLRETDAAARAFANGDQAPLLRLMADALTNTDSRDPSGDPTRWSSGLAVAVMCGDAPQIFDMRLPVRERRAQFERAIAERKKYHPDTYAPFTIDEYRGLPLDYAFIEQCLEWPPPMQPPPHAPSEVVPLDAKYPAVPALVISSEYDNMTTVADGAAAAKAFPRGRQLILANSFHVNALPHARSDCAAGITRRFVASLDPGDTSCTAGVPELRLAPDFATSVARVDPAEARPGNTADETALRCANAAVQTAGDIVTRLHSNTSGHGVGLRGGTFIVQQLKERTAARATLNAVRWTNDLAISGRVDWGGQRSDVSAHLTFDQQGPCGAGDLRAHWPQIAVNARATVAGLIGRSKVDAQTDAP
jgi:pimeloyl-ACP methyl ester carboxylesterase